MRRWGDENTLKFIDLYHQNECLWNIKSTLYKNRLARENAYRNILETMKSHNNLCNSVKFVKNKIKNLRSIYHTELRKIKRSAKHSDGTSVYKPSLTWFDLMHSFLGDSVAHFDNDDEINDKEMLISTISDEIDNDPMEMVLLGELSTEESNNYRPSTKSNEKRINQRIKKYTKKSLSDYSQMRINPTDKNAISLKGDQTAQDEFYFFGLSVAAQLRKLPIHLAMETQTNIQSILSQARLHSIFPNSPGSLPDYHNEHS